MTSMQALLSLSSAALCISTCALYVALRSSARSQSRRLSALSTRLDHTDALIDLLQVTFKDLARREQARLTMQRLRANEKMEPREADTFPGSNGQSQPLTEDVEAAKDRWQRETNLKIARGEIKPLRGF